ncbi:MAG: ABC transporter substrate-binding protein, partial [Ignisphaera sp.]
MVLRGVAKTTLVIVIVIAIAIAVIGVSYLLLHMERTSKEEAETQTYFTVTDILNRSVKIPKNLSRVVAIGPGALRLIAYLNATNLLVGVEEAELSWSPTGRDYAMAYSTIFKSLPVIGPGGPNRPPDPEKLRTVKPQLIIMSRTYADLYPPDRLAEEVNASVFVIDYGVAGYLDIDGIKNALMILGKVLGREERAKELVNYINQLVSDLNNRTRDIASRPKVYVGA